MAAITLIDNYDSFTYNLVHYFNALGADVTVVRNDALSVDALISAKPRAIVISPGPATPDTAGICLPLLATLQGRIPLLGVCLGHQAIGQAYGGKVIRAAAPMHGKTSEIHHRGEGVFKDIPSPFVAARYHSLIVERASLPSCLTVTAETADGTIMGLMHREHPVHGVQFHPESIASHYGHRLLENFLKTL